MDIPLPILTMELRDVEAKAQAFADALINQLNSFNDRIPTPRMSESAQAFLKETPGGLPGPTPEQQRERFIALFYRYMASHRVILPDEEPLDL
jgi:hypothetical protein